jgi:hypothetical protein
VQVVELIEICLKTNRTKMATSKGIIDFQGTIGGITFYRRKGKLCARQAAGPSKEKIAASKKCKRTRENNAEFKGAVTASKLLRQGLNPFIKDFADWNISGRLNGVFRKVIDRSAGIRGERPIEILPNKNLLIGFNLHKEVSFDSTFQAPFTASANSDRNEVTLRIPDFDSSKLINAPAGATHFRIVHAITVVPKFVYDPLSKRYLRADGITEILNGDSYSDYIALNGMIGSDIILPTVLPSTTIISSDSGIVCLIGIQFYQEVNSEKYLLSDGSCMKIYNVF